MHLSAVTPKPQKPARRLVRRAPTTAPWTGLKKVEKTNQNSLHCTLGTGRFLKLPNSGFPRKPEHWFQMPSFVPNCILRCSIFGGLLLLICNTIVDRVNSSVFCGIEDAIPPLLHPAPRPPVTLSKPTAFLGHYPRRGRPYCVQDPPTLSPRQPAQCVPQNGDLANVVLGGDAQTTGTNFVEMSKVDFSCSATQIKSQL